jgi:hypothetical protein
MTIAIAPHDPLAGLTDLIGRLLEYGPVGWLLAILFGR